MPRADDFLPLHPLELRILMALADGPSYGTRIVGEIESREGRGATLYPANLYRRIRNLMGAGLVEDAPAPADADPRRSYLRLTRLGRSVAKAEARRLRALVADAAAHRLLPEG
jgi:DNA-binding PadR family transcriptional regulator